MESTGFEEIGLELKQELHLLRTIIDNIPDPIYVKDLEGRKILLNKAEAELLNASSIGEVIGKTDEFFYPPDVAAETRLEDNQVIETRIPMIHREGRVITKSGEEMWFEGNKIPFYDEKGALSGIIGISHDITHRKKTLEALIAARQQAEQSTRAKELFLAQMSHEIRTPLNAIIGMVRMLRDSKVEDSQMRLLDNMKSSSENLLGIINDILDFSKIESGQIEMSHNDFNLHEIFRRVYDANAFRAEEKGLKIGFSVDERIGNFFRGDAVRLQQILNNLVSNAIKFTLRGSVEMVCELRAKGMGKESILFRVSDTGIGISPENQERIFESFKQEDESITRTFGGTGLGLSISRQLVGLMGGVLSVESVKEKGSTFFFTIEFETGSRQPDTPGNVKGSDKNFSMKGIRVLLVEDNKFNQFIAKAILEKWGATTIILENGQQAIDMLRTETVDLVLMDIQMPVMDGITAATIIRKELKLEVPILAITANVVLGIIERCRQAGMQGYISKPFDEDDLRNKIHAVVGDREEKMEIGKEKEEEIRVREEIALCDTSRLEKMVGNAPGMLKMMIDKFLEVTPDYVKELSAALDQRDVEAIGRSAHKIKSAIDLVSNDTMRSLIKKINDDAREGSKYEPLAELVRQFLGYFAMLTEQLEKRRAAI
ncbi:MAG: ATP-binding protein [bacterium]